MKAQTVPPLRAGARRRPGREFEHGAGAGDDPRRPPGRQALVDRDHLPLFVEEEGVDGVAHAEGVDRAAGGDPQPLALAERGSKEQAAKPPEEGFGAADALAQDHPRCLVHRSEHGRSLA